MTHHVIPMQQAALAVRKSRGSSINGPQALGKGIVPQELLPIVMACMTWGPWWRRDGSIVTYCDNQAVVHIIDSG